jgi:hypothetical protein
MAQREHMSVRRSVGATAMIAVAASLLAAAAPAALHPALAAEPDPLGARVAATVADAMSCERGPELDVTVEARREEPEFDHSHDIAWLTSRPGRAAAPDERYTHALGLTQSALEPDFRAEWMMLARPEGGVCAALTTATVTLVWRTTVYIAKELPWRSCSYREVLAHENKHVALDATLFDQFAADIRKAVERAAKSIGIVRETSAERAGAAIRKRLQRALGAVMDEFSERRNARQLAIDTPREYDRLAAACGEETRQILRNLGL